LLQVAQDAASGQDNGKRCHVEEESSKKLHSIHPVNLIRAVPILTVSAHFCVEVEVRPMASAALPFDVRRWKSREWGEVWRERKTNRKHGTALGPLLV
jgi:hypothetical protein